MKHAALFAALLLLALPACSGGDKGAEPDASGEKAETKPDTESAETKKEPVRPTTPEMFAASHVLVAYKGAMRANPEISRTKEEALARAKEVIKKLDEGAEFAAVAKEYSDGPSAPRGGNLGSFAKGRMVGPFQDAVDTLAVNKYTAEPVETDFGYHVILRTEPPPPPKIYGAKHILIAWEGASRAAPTVTRTKDEAMALANDLLKQATAPGADFGALAKENSDGPSGPRGGDLGRFPENRMVKPFSEAVAATEVGKVHPKPVESPFGYHVILRTE